MNKKKAIFLDRDGVINQNRNDYVKNINELKIFDFVGSSINELKRMGFLVLIVTNQSAINRGITTEKSVNEIHERIQKYLKKFGNISLLPIEHYNFDGDFIESQAFGYLAIRSYLNMPITFPTTTGCIKPCTGGQIIQNF